MYFPLKKCSVSISLECIYRGGGPYYLKIWNTFFKSGKTIILSDRKFVLVHDMVLYKYFTFHGPSDVRRYGENLWSAYNQSSSIAFDETLVTGQRQKAPNFSAFHCQHFVTTRVVHLPKRTETSFITEANLISESDQAVRAMHSYSSWFYTEYCLI